MSTKLFPNWNEVYATQAFALAERGYEVTASDLSRQAIELARTVSAFFFLKCFSDEQPGDVGPYRLTTAEIENTFSAAFEVPGRAL